LCFFFGVEIKLELSVRDRQSSAVKIEEFVHDNMSYELLLGHWCDIVLDVHVLVKDES